MTFEIIELVKNKRRLQEIDPLVLMFSQSQDFIDFISRNNLTLPDNPALYEEWSMTNLTNE